MSPIFLVAPIKLPELTIVLAVGVYTVVWLCFFCPNCRLTVRFRTRVCSKCGQRVSRTRSYLFWAGAFVGVVSFAVLQVRGIGEQQPLLGIAGRLIVAAFFGVIVSLEAWLVQRYSQ